MSSDNISQNIEEYLEVLYRNGSNKEQVSTTTLSKELNIAPGSVTQMLKKLEKLDYIEYVPYKGASLTDAGMKIAQKITRKHRILEKFLTDILKIKDENVHEQACEMEHSLSDEAERALCFMLNQPDLCPDEKIIPACNFMFGNCNDCISEKDFDNVVIRDNNLLSLSEVNSNADGIVHFIRGNEDLIDEIKSVGIDIGTEIDFNKKDNIITLLDDGTSISPSKDFLNNIFIKI
ncbi:MAG: metal-dependent transcriptional regulator [Methanobrevibacter sp.]|uniref:metal-dependent transcriptional regulator n=1 Tax=Methanobrevibacter sp. TaxID=66852 RepID=UPI0026E007DA|nr:metal-dependent transcriptional regulator [Methanobrevibacter sp.]MDO5849134.1 metal-dependent transcriptional regulator [Methanobrevibacter sp.]